MTLQPHQLRALSAGQPLPPPLPRKPRSNEESTMQRALIRWWQVNCRVFGVPEILLLSIPNGGNGSAKRGSIMKAEGQRKGAPDLMLAVVRPSIAHYQAPAFSKTEHRNGLFLELKTRKGTVSPEQEVFHQRLTEQGYRVRVCRTLVECINEITAYLT
jgi:hypothetical protein